VKATHPPLTEDEQEEEDFDVNEYEEEEEEEKEEPEEEEEDDDDEELRTSAATAGRSPKGQPVKKMVRLFFFDSRCQMFMMFLQVG
jgi:hypothetical protein